MNVVDIYLRQVGRWLPGMRKQAHLARIREDLEELLETAGDDSERQQRLAQFGRPAVVAARYADFPHVIPGMLAPAYFMVLGVSIAVMLLIHATLVIPRHLHGEAWLSNLGLVFSTALGALPWVFTVITLVFAGLGYGVQRRALPGRR